jgi:hypothetical protein
MEDIVPHAEASLPDPGATDQQVVEHTTNPLT